eukprot:TRINITY_DN7723_c0_g1_i3.p1 TRINITY_DN7723_c0_g1~~TRINITY_DN7723_c0_g1_i3.p1  ORF type:complete len:322 (-),score=64.26 TRINITY_DN7723_c0_g1_i3:148-1113(-)
MKLSKFASNPAFVHPLLRRGFTPLVFKARFSTSTNEAKDKDKDDYNRVKDAMEAKKKGIEENSKLSPDNVNEIYSTPSIDFGSDYTLPHPIWKADYLQKVAPDHKPPTSKMDFLAYWTIQAIRFNFDWMSGWVFGKVTPEKALSRIVFLESIAGVPGSIAGILRHLASLRGLRRDNGWIHTLFEEAENERMHLLTAIELKKPTPFFKLMVWLSQGVFFNFFFLSYLISPKFCHRLVGYLEEQAVVTYSKIIHEIESPDGGLKEWDYTPAPEIARQYWKLAYNSSIKDVIYVIRADESHHMSVNHSFAGLGHTDPNPFKPGH